MTPNGEPTTEAGRAMLRDPMYRFAIGHILAIEAEARATATPGLREALHKAICYSDHTILSRDFEMSRRRCVIAEGVVRAARSASGETEPAR